MQCVPTIVALQDVTGQQPGAQTIMETNTNLGTLQIQQVTLDGKAITKKFLTQLQPVSNMSGNGMGIGYVNVKIGKANYHMLVMNDDKLYIDHRRSLPGAWREFDQLFI